MAKSRMVMACAALAVLVVLVMAVACEAQTCPGPLSLIDCQSAVTKLGAEPNQLCCDEISKVQDGPDGPKCLCEATTSQTAKDLGVIPEQALRLPQACQLKYQKGYVCDGRVVPGGQ